MTSLLVYALALFTLAPATVGPGECVVFAPLGGQAQVIGGDECGRRTLPASTFKVPHALVALETGVVTEKTVIKWDGTRRDYPVWNRDQTLDSAVKMSAVWVFSAVRLCDRPRARIVISQIVSLRIGNVRARRH